MVIGLCISVLRVTLGARFKNNNMFNDTLQYPVAWGFVFVYVVRGYLGHPCEEQGNGLV